MQQAACASRAAAPCSSSTAGPASARRAAAAAAPRRSRCMAQSSKEVLERAADRSQGEADPTFDARAFRRSLNSTGRYTRKPSNDPDSLQLMEEHGVGYSTTGLVAQMRETGNTWKQVGAGSGGARLRCSGAGRVGDGSGGRK